MKKCLLLAAALFCTCATVFAQNPNKITIKGVVRDTSGSEITMPTVMLLNPKDSTLVNFTRGDGVGVFEFKNVRNVPYLLKVSYLGYLPLQKHLAPSPTEVNDLGTVGIKPITTELMEVVIKTAKATLSIRGDTVEYDASSFKVPPGSTVEDLLRRLPGIEVDADGNIRAQGKDVKRVYVDGKTFFSDDPKAATKNLGAETISKVQVYNEKSEQAKLTGVDDGKKDKAMNLELKAEYKKGAFGKITGAMGTEERWAGRGNYNRFNTKEQFSVIAYGNNTNQTGVNWEDYGEFKGQNTFNDQDNGDFGFGSGQRFFFYGGGDDEPLNNFDGRGFTTNFGAGTNYNFDNKKLKFNANYFYNQTDLDLDQYAFRQTFFQDSSFTNTDTTLLGTFRGNHSVATRLEHEIDSNNLIIVKARARFGTSSEDNVKRQLFSKNTDLPTNSLNIDNNSRLDAFRLNSSAIYRHRFKKKGRSFALSAGYNHSNSDGTENLFSINRFFRANTVPDQLRQLNQNNNGTQQVKSSVLFTEPLAKKWYWEAFYNFSTTNNEVDRQVANPDKDSQRVDSLSVYYDNDLLYNRVGSSLRYSNKGLNVSAGLAAQQIQLKGQYAIAKGLPSAGTPIDRNFANLVPNVQMNYQLPGNKWLNVNYGYNVREPQLNELQPVPNVNNPAFRMEGNPDLAPERSHNLGLGFNHWNPATFASIGFGGDFNLYDSQIVYNQTVEVLKEVGIRTTSRPDNVSGGNRLNAYTWLNFPIVKTKLTMNAYGNVNGGKSPAFVNGVQNDTRNLGFNLNAGLNFTPAPKLIMGLDGEVGFNNITYSIQDDQNQKIRSYGLEASAKWQFANKSFFESNFNYAVYQNDRFGFNQNVPIWNASVRRLFGKQNRIETRLAAFDLLNRRVSITQDGSQNFVTRNIANTLARYFMLSAAYNIRGYENKLKKNNWW